MLYIYILSIYCTSSISLLMRDIFLPHFQSFCWLCIYCAYGRGIYLPFRSWCSQGGKVESIQPLAEAFKAHIDCQNYKISAQCKEARGTEDLQNCSEA